MLIALHSDDFILEASGGGIFDLRKTFTALFFLLLLSSSALRASPVPAGWLAAAGTADCIIVGKVVRVESNAFGAPTVAVVRVQQGLKGWAGLPEARIAVAAMMDEGFTGCFLLRRGEFDHPYTFVDRHHGILADVSETLFARLVAAKLDPMRHLTSADPEDRLCAVYVLLSQYSGNKDNSAPAIDSRQNQLILQTLRDADWSKGVDTVSPDQVTPYAAFELLGLSFRDGYRPPRGIPMAASAQAKQNAAAREWLVAHADSFQIHNYSPR